MTEYLVGWLLGQIRADFAHIVRWDPERVLAECDAKRRIVAICDGAARGEGERVTAQTVLAEETLRHLALPYADRPGYREGMEAVSELPSPRHNPDAVPPCPVCGAALDVSWFETIGLAGGAPRLIPGRIVCGDRPHHDVSLSANQFQIIEVAHHDHGQPYRCPLYLLGWWRDQGWFPTDLDFQTSTEAVEHRVWEQATRRS